MTTRQPFLYYILNPFRKIRKFIYGNEEKEDNIDYSNLIPADYSPDTEEEQLELAQYYLLMYMTNKKHREHHLLLRGNKNEIFIINLFFPERFSS